MIQEASPFLVPEYLVFRAMPFDGPLIPSVIPVPNCLVVWQLRRPF